MSTTDLERAAQLGGNFTHHLFHLLGESDNPVLFAEEVISRLGIAGSAGENIRRSAQTELELRLKKATGAWSVPHITVETVDRGTFRLVCWDSGHTLIEDVYEGGREQLLAKLPELRDAFMYRIEDSEREKLSRA